MAVHRAAFAAAIYLLCFAGHSQRASSFAPNALAVTTTTSGRSARDRSSTAVLRAEPTATEKAAELRARAEEAKRKAEELKKVAEQKAEAVMDASPARPAESGGGKAEATAAPSASSTGGAIIPVNRENVEFASGVLAGGLALALGASPMLAVVAAAAVNYVSKKDDLGELHELVQALSRASLNTVNWIAKLDSKYAILGKLSESLDRSIGELKNSDSESAEAFKSIEETVSKTTKQIQKLADEIDLLEGGKQALGAVGEVLETSIDKAVDANKEYKLTERAAEAAKKAVERAKELNK
ncbi:hypothetical protein ACHAW5_002316 [Stephanodiscus triporus]|uniref:Uncharacterized protein n=1 Tax=Stephanodiscus triporus TaxID=2934178 RepID=A0ABD3MJL0_9STRA